MKLLLLLFTGVTAFSQPLSFGLKGGLPLNDAFALANGGYTAGGRHLTAGPMIELRLPFGLGMEFDVFYKRLSYRYMFGRPGLGFENSKTTANSWEFPLLAKYRLGHSLLAPYVAAGISVNRLSGVKRFGEIMGAGPAGVLTTFTSTDIPELHRRSSLGSVFGAGIEIRLVLLRVSPEIRYTRWRSPHFTGVLPDTSFQSSQNQAEFLVGLTF